MCNDTCNVGSMDIFVARLNLHEGCHDSGVTMPITNRMLMSKLCGINKLGWHVPVYGMNQI